MKLTLCLAALLMIPAAASAQSDPGPFGGLFGRTPDRSGREYTVLEIRASGGGLYTTSVPPDELAAAGVDTQSSAGALASGVLTFERVSDRLTTSISGSAGHEQYFLEPDPYRATAFQGGARIATKLTTRLGLEGGATYAHSPYYQLTSGLGQPGVSTGFLPPVSAGAVAFAENESYNGNASFSAQLAKRTSFRLMGYHHETRFRDQPESNLFVNGGRATLTQQLSKDFGAHAGYGREQSTPQPGDTTEFVSEVIDVGIDFNRQLSLARRTTLGFSTSTGLLKDGSDSQFRLNGSVSLSKHFRRTWQAVIAANRSTEFRPGFVEPLFSDSIGALIGGMLSQRMDWVTSVSAGRGSLAFSGTTGFNNIMASTALTFGITRSLGIYTQYLTYFYEAPPGATTLPVPGRMERRTISVGLTAYIPVLNRMRAIQ